MSGRQESPAAIRGFFFGCGSGDIRRDAFAFRRDRHVVVPAKAGTQLLNAAASGGNHFGERVPAPAAGSIFFARPKKMDEKKGRPRMPTLRVTMRASLVRGFADGTSLCRCEGSPSWLRPCYARPDPHSVQCLAASKGVLEARFSSLRCLAHAEGFGILRSPVSDIEQKRARLAIEIS